MSEAPVCYGYDPQSGVLQSATYADPSPLEKGAYLFPAHSTQVAPPKADAGFVAVWKGAAWTTVEDHRGELWWASSQDHVLITDVGDPASWGWTKDRPESVPEGKPAWFVVSQFQFMARCAISGIITQDEAKAYLGMGTIPAILQAAIDQIKDPQDAFLAEAKFIAATEFSRDDPYTLLLQGLMGETDEFMDALWQGAAQL